MNITDYRKNILLPCVLAASLLEADRCSGAEGDHARLPVMPRTNPGTLMRVGIISDTHVDSRKSSCGPLSAFFQLFRENRVDLIIHCGDIADRYDPRAYRNYREAFHDVFADRKIPEFFVYAGHDAAGYPHWENWNYAFAEVKKNLGIANRPDDVIRFRNRTFLIFQERINAEHYEETIRNAVRQYPGEPVFVLDHRPAYDTVDNSLEWGCRIRRRILERYPQAVQISGHIHSSLRNERCIWQNQFTVIEAGCLQKWHGVLVGAAAEPAEAYGATIMDVCTDRLEIHRFCLDSDGRQKIERLRTFIIPLPFDPANAPCNFEHRKKLSAAPEFAPDAEISLAFDRIPFSRLQMKFPEAAHPDGVFRYRIELERCGKDGKWTRYARQDVRGGFHLEPAKRGTIVHELDSGLFDAGTLCRIRITPENVFGITGRPLYQETAIPDLQKTEVICDMTNPMGTCCFKNDASDIPLRQSGDGFYHHGTANARLEFPTHTWDAPAGTRFRLTIEMHARKTTFGQWTMMLRDSAAPVFASPKIYVESGDSGSLRYVIEAVKNRKQQNFVLLLQYRYYAPDREEGDGEVRFDRVRVERLSPPPSPNMKGQ